MAAFWSKATPAFGCPITRVWTGVDLVWFLGRQDCLWTLLSKVQLGQEYAFRSTVTSADRMHFARCMDVYGPQEVPGRSVVRILGGSLEGQESSTRVISGSITGSEVCRPGSGGMNECVSH